MPPAISTPLLSSPADVLRLVGGAGVLALDLETTSLSPLAGKARLCSLSDGRTHLVTDLWEHDPRAWLPALHGKILVIHNGMFDLSWLWHLELQDLPETICTYLVAKLLSAGEETSCSLASTVYRYLDGMQLPKDLQTSDWSGSLSTDQIEYARRDATILLPLLQALDGALDKAQLHRAADIEMRALRAFVWLSQTGAPFDCTAWVALAASAAEQKHQLNARLDADAPQKGQDGLFGPVEHWNWDSPQQVQEVLRLLGFPVQTTADAQLALLDEPFAELVRDYRHQATLLKMYGPNWLDAATIRDGRVYPNWRQLGTVTGRTSCAEPNVQQVPREEDPQTKRTTYRVPFAAPPGRVLVKADYHTLQMRIACRYARDVALLNVFRRGDDVHAATARSTLGKAEPSKADRQIAKSQNFGLLFGMSAEGLRIYAKTTYGVTFTKEEAEQHRAAFFKAYPGLANWHQDTRRRRVAETRSWSGRRRLLHLTTPDTERLNSPVQGDESDGLKLALALLWERRAECAGAFPVLVVHDEIVLECPVDQAEQAKAWLTSAMTDAMGPVLDPVPVKVDAVVVPTWGG